MVHVLREQKSWVKVTDTLVQYTHRRLLRFGHNNLAVAEELAMDAIEKALAASSGAKLLHRSDLSYYLGGIVNGLVINYVRRHEFRPAAQERIREDYELPEDQMETQVDARRRLQRYVERTHRLIAQKGTHLDKVLFNLLLAGVHEPRNQVERSGYSLREVRNSSRRLKKIIAKAILDDKKALKGPSAPPLCQPIL